jgi:hypothetical protein
MEPAARQARVGVVAEPSVEAWREDAMDRVVDHPIANSGRGDQAALGRGDLQQPVGRRRVRVRDHLAVEPYDRLRSPRREALHRRAPSLAALEVEPRPPEVVRGGDLREEGAEASHGEEWRRWPAWTFDHEGLPEQAGPGARGLADPAAPAR